MGEDLASINLKMIYDRDSQSMTAKAKKLEAS